MSSFRERQANGVRLQAEWNVLLGEYAAKFPEKAADLEHRRQGQLGTRCEEILDNVDSSRFQDKSNAGEQWRIDGRDLACMWRLNGRQRRPRQLEQPLLLRRRRSCLRQAGPEVSRHGVSPGRGGASPIVGVEESVPTAWAKDATASIGMVGYGWVLCIEPRATMSASG
ncbi:uncharacterized protein A1O5_11928 [Cladophialophora psammophila CBS 110553]|uniref:Uncharacterized protein n=1 Tax=Cladophialophora psammophila CBS 110553 TaxID=1182543 RepID=W9W8R5_9EURO|nr:uncharacterized protein A1O5_11928 [Cladophialophora psammophila CBS 110553]EXJ61370.1 hypothetical protein A1O5_11928 [Cladophialophora psammophila CBS 110553]